jgi:hypothetical protein
MFRFTTREAFLCTTIAALAVGWLADRWQLISRFENVGMLRIEKQIQRGIAHTMTSQAKDCWTSLQWERKEKKHFAASS